MDGVRSTERIVETIQSLSPDMVCFQEVHKRLPWSGIEDQPRRLAKLLGYPFTFHQLLNLGFGGYGIGIASRRQPAQVHRHLLPSRKEQRGLLELEFSGREVEEVPFHLFCTHWGLDVEERIRQAHFCVDIVTTKTLPVLFCGDLNAAMDSEEVTILREGCGFRDAGIALKEPTYPADHPTSRIDYLFCSKDWQMTEFSVVKSLASDHLPVLADVSCETI